MPGPRAGHPRSDSDRCKAWMAGTSPAMTSTSNRHVGGHPLGSRPPRQALEHRVLHPAEMPHADRVIEHPLARLPAMRLAMQQGVIERVGKPIAAAHAGEIFIE